MRILVTGSRGWTDWAVIFNALLTYAGGESVTVLHGAAKGADSLAAQAAEDLGYHVVPWPADWNTHGKKAGMIRNFQMLDTNPDVVLAFRVNGSRGTTHCIEAARKRGIPVELYER